MPTKILKNINAKKKLIIFVDKMAEKMIPKKVTNFLILRKKLISKLLLIFSHILKFQKTVDWTVPIKSSWRFLTQKSFNKLLIIILQKLLLDYSKNYTKHFTEEPYFF